MPMDSVTQEPRAQEWGLFQVNNWHLHFCLWPRTCYLTGKQLWFKRCYQGWRLIMGPGSPIEDYYYVDRDEFIMWNLKRNYNGTV